MGVDAAGVFRVEVVGGNGGITGVDDIAQFGALTEFNKEELRCEGLLQKYFSSTLRSNHKADFISP